MGIIKRQALKHTGVSALGLVIGAVSNLFIYPLAWELYGFTQFIIGLAGLLYPFASLGIASVAIKYFPDFQKTPSDAKTFLGLLILSSLVAFVGFSAIAFLAGNPLLDLLAKLNMEGNIFSQNKILVLAILGFLALNRLLAAYISNFKRIVIPALFSNILHKIILPVLIISATFNLIGLTQFKIGFVAMYLITSLGYFWYLSKLGNISPGFDLSVFETAKLKEIFTFALLSSLTMLGSVLAFRIDTIMVSSFLGYKSNGFYSFFLFMSNVMIMPYTAIAAITNPAISTAWNKLDLTEISTIYRQSSELLFIAASLILLGTWTCIDDLLNLTTKLQLLQPYKSLFLILGIGQLLNLTSGVNQGIIAYSKFYWVNLIAILILGIIAVYLNYLLIPTFGLLGAAYATCISLLAFNFIKYLFIWWKFGMQPIGRVHLHVALISLIAFGLAAIPTLNFHPVLNILIRGTIFTLAFTVPMIRLHISPQINTLWLQFKDRIFSIIQ